MVLVEDGTPGLLFLLANALGSALMLVSARLRHVAATQWGSRRYLDMDKLQTKLQELWLLKWSGLDRPSSFRTTLTSRGHKTNVRKLTDATKARDRE